MSSCLFFFLGERRPPRSPLFPYTTLFRSNREPLELKGALPKRDLIRMKRWGAAAAGFNKPPTAAPAAAPVLLGVEGIPGSDFILVTALFGAEESEFSAEDCLSSPEVADPLHFLSDVGRGPQVDEANCNKK